MSKWHTLSARFTDDEMKLIERFKKKNKLNDNELIRNGVTFVVGLGTMMEALQNPDFHILRSYVGEIQKELNSPRYEKAMEKATKRWADKVKEQQIQRLDVELSEVQKELNVFQQKRPRGRPKIIRARGHPRI